MNKNIFTKIQEGNIPDTLKQVVNKLSSSFDENNYGELEKVVQLAYL
jgi:BioD-like phosphotransacetylase family protein